jgi:hypothetical protein
MSAIIVPHLTYIPNMGGILQHMHRVIQLVYSIRIMDFTPFKYGIPLTSNYGNTEERGNTN